MSAELKRVGPGQLALHGVLDFDSVASLWPQLAAQLETADTSPLTLSLQPVSGANSAALALLLEALEWAAKHQRTLRFEGVPQDVLDLAQLCRVEGLLQGSDASGGAD